DVPGYQALRLADPLGADPWPDREAPAAAHVAELVIAAAALPDEPRTRLAVTLALQAADAVVRSAFRRDPVGDPDVLAEATALVPGCRAARRGACGVPAGWVTGPARDPRRGAAARAGPRRRNAGTPGGRRGAAAGRRESRPGAASGRPGRGVTPPGSRREAARP